MKTFGFLIVFSLTSGLTAGGMAMAGAGYWALFVGASCLLCFYIGHETGARMVRRVWNIPGPK